MLDGGKTNAETVWSAARKYLREKKECAEHYDQWFGVIIPLEMDSRMIRLGVNDTYFAEWLEDNYYDFLVEALTAAAGAPIEPVFEPGHAPQIEERRDEPRQEELDPSDSMPVEAPNCLPHHTFANFVTGECNRYAYFSAQMAASQPGSFNPLYIYGAPGTGKTHLLQAVAHETLQKNPAAVVEYVTCEEFLNLYVDSLKNKSPHKFRHRFRGVDVLLVDDIHQLTGKPQLQEEFFNTFNSLYNRGKQILLTSDKEPAQINGLEQRLTSRFAMGVTTQITIPEYETRLAILKVKSEAFATHFPDEVLEFIAAGITRDMRILEGALCRLAAFASAMSHPSVTIEVAEQLLGTVFDKEAAGRRPVRIDDIIKKVAEYFDLSTADLLSQKRPKHIAEPRMIAMYMAREMTNQSYPEIGESFRRNHATVIHANKSIKNRCGEDAGFKRMLDEITEQVRN